MKIAILGLGEAGSHFANDLVEMGVNVSGWDPIYRNRQIYPDSHAGQVLASSKSSKYPLNKRVTIADNNPDAVKNADIIFSANYTSESKAIAKEVVSTLKEGAIYCEMNTSAPTTKQEIATILKPANIQFVDLAIMAPVPPKGMKVPLLASGKGAKLLAKLLAPYHLNISVLSDKAGDAAGRKLLRSIVYKGVAAVICEAMEAGEHFGLEDYIRTQINSIIGENDALIDRFVKGSRTHAKRRMHEMEAVVNMLEGADLTAFMANGSVKNLEKYFKN